MSPPGLRATPRAPGGTTSPGSHELAVRAAHKALRDCGVEILPCKVNRILRGFEKRARREGVTFHEFLSGAAGLTPGQRRRIAADPDLQRVIAYTDPTGETAVDNILKRAGRVR